MGLLHRQKFNRVTVWIRVSVRLRFRFSFSGAKLLETHRFGMWVNCRSYLSSLVRLSQEIGLEGRQEMTYFGLTAIKP